MTDDEDVERALQGYRPADPSPDLRDRIVARVTGRSRWRDWIPAAAALVVACVFHALAAREQQRVASRITRADEIAIREAVSAMVDAAGGIVPREELEWWLRVRAADAPAFDESVQ